MKKIDNNVQVAIDAFDTTYSKFTGREPETRFVDADTLALTHLLRLLGNQDVHLTKDQASQVGSVLSGFDKLDKGIFIGGAERVLEEIKEELKRIRAELDSVFQGIPS